MTVLLAVESRGATEPPASLHVDDPDRLLPHDAAATAALEAKLNRFERTSGIELRLEFHPKSPTAAEDKVPGAYMRALAERRGTAERGVIAVYFADEDDWRVWIGDALTARFAGQPGTAHELTKSGAIHDAKEALLAAAKARADAVALETPRSAHATPSISPAQRLQLHADALVDGLIERLRSKEDERR